MTNAIYRTIRTVKTVHLLESITLCSKVECEFDEGEHPRDDDGKFAYGGGAGGGGDYESYGGKPDATFDREPGQRVASASNMKKLEKVGMEIETSRNPRLRFTSNPDGYADMKSRLPQDVQTRLGTAMHPTRFPVDAIDHETKTVYEEKIYSKQAKDIKIKSGRLIDRRRKAMVANSLGYKLKTRLILMNGKPEIYEMDGFKGVRPHQMTRIE